MSSLSDRENYPSSSALNRYFECGASYRMGLLAQEWSQLPADEEVATESGIRIHEAIRRSDSRNLVSDDERNLYSKIQHKLNSFLDYWGAHPDDEELRETRFWLHDEFGLMPIMSGQLDYARICDNEALIIDLKTGWNRPPDPVGNHQLLSLAVLLKTARPKLRSITIQIISPHYDFRPYQMKTAELNRYEKELRKLLAALVLPAQQPVTGDHCKHCKGILICPEMRRNAVSLMKMGKEEEFPASLPDGTQGARVLADCRVLGRFLQKVEEHYKALLANDPDAVPGWQLKPGTNVRQFESVTRAFPILHDMIGDKILGALSISVPKVEALLNGQIPAELITTRQNAPTLQPVKKLKDAV